MRTVSGVIYARGVWLVVLCCAVYVCMDMEMVVFIKLLLSI